MIETYRPSGQVGALTFPLWLLTFLPVALLAYVYQLGLYWIPLIFLSFIMTLGVAFACGWMMRFVVQRGPCRNVVLAAVMGVVLCLVTVAAKHAFQYFAFRSEVAEAVIAEDQVPEAEREAVRRAINEAITVPAYIEFRTDQGWEIGRGGGNGIQVNGFFVYLVWLVEAGIIAAGAVLGYSAARHPFSETLYRWADEEETVATIPAHDPLVFQRIREAQLVDDLISPPAADPAAKNQFLVYKVHSVPGEEMEDAFLSIVHTTVTVDKNGKKNTKQDVLQQFVVLQKKLREQLVQNIEALRS